MKLFLLACLLVWSSLSFAQQSLVPSYRNDRISTDFNGNPFDWQQFFRPNFTQNLISNEGRLAQRGGVGEVLYYYRATANFPGQQTLRRPVIILDGFDPLDTRSGEEIYGKQLSYVTASIPSSRILLGDILRGIAPGSTDNFDAIILNFPRYRDRLQRADQDEFTDGGAGDIRDNAMILVALIDQVNAELAQAGSQEEIVVIGPSMGGLISRFALAHMEAQGRPHRCRLWVSFDAPHLGANIAIGAQQFLRSFASNGLESAQESYDVQINSIAARQMLLHHAESFSFTAQGVWNRDEFLNDLLANGLPGSGGFPQNMQKVAIANGSIIGQRFASQECVPALGMSSTLSFINPGWLGNTPLFISRALFGQIPAASAQLNYSGSNNTFCQTAQTRFLTVNNAGWGTSPGLSLDYIPGGSFSTFQTIADEGSGFSFRANTTFNVQRPSHSFIPLKSALAFNYPNTAGTVLNPAVGNLAENLAGRNLVCEGLTPFDAYFAPQDNEEHVALTQASVDFILPHIRGTADPVFRVTVPNSFPIQGASSCPSTNPSGTTYSILASDIPADATGFQWIASPGLQIVGANNGQSVVVRRLGGASNQEWVRARIITPCRILEAERRLLGRGFSSSDYPITGPTSAGNNQQVNYLAPDLWGATTYQWIIPSGWEVVSGLNTRFLTLRTPAFGSGSGQVGVRVGNDCDAGGSPAIITTNYCSGCTLGRPGPATTEPQAPSKPFLFPNPAARAATLAVGADRGQPGQVLLLNTNGKVVGEVASNQFTYYPEQGQYRVTLDLAALPAGVYIVRVALAQEVATLKLVVQPSSQLSN